MNSLNEISSPVNSNTQLNQYFRDVYKDRSDEDHLRYNRNSIELLRRIFSSNSQVNTFNFEPATKYAVPRCLNEYRDYVEGVSVRRADSPSDSNCTGVPIEPHFVLQGCYCLQICGLVVRKVNNEPLAIVSCETSNVLNKGCNIEVIFCAYRRSSTRFR